MMKNLYKIFCGLVVWLLACMSGLHAQDIDPSTWSLNFNEEFDTLSVSKSGPLGTGPGETTWASNLPYPSGFGVPHASPTDTFPFTVKDGILRIEARFLGEDKCETTDWA